MKLSQMTKEEIEQLSYTKIAELYLKENKTTLNTASLFKVVCQLLELDEETYKEKMPDFFESLTTAKEFILLADGNWDLKINHKVKIDIDDIYEDEEIEINAKEEDIEIEEMEDNIDEEENYDDITDDDFEEDELSDLSIVAEEELED